MQMNLNKSWIDNMNNLCQMFLMPVMLVLLFLYNTIVNSWVGGRIETLQNLLAIMILCVFVCNIFSSPKKNILGWFKDNKLVFFYFVVRLISLMQSGFEYSVIRSIFFEAFILICITDNLVLQNRMTYIKLFASLQLVFSLLSLGMYYSMNMFSDSYTTMLYNWTNLEKCQNALLFGNPNTAGIMAGFGIVVAIICYKRQLCNNKLVIAYGLFNVVALVLFGCRSADVGIIAVILVSIAIRDGAVMKKFTYIALIGAAASTMLLYGVMAMEGGINSLEMSDLELKINSLSTGRYLIWNECAVEQQDSFIFGEGSLRAEQEERQEQFNGTAWELEEAAKLGPHNGYIGMISATGITGLLLFILIMLDKIRKSKNIDNHWALILIYIFVINCFESLFILNRFFTCFFMLYILASESDDRKRLY